MVLVSTVPQKIGTPDTNTRIPSEKNPGIEFVLKTLVDQIHIVGW